VLISAEYYKWTTKSDIMRTIFDESST